ncbi:MAG TPA: hypothetical protein VJT31_19185, partial [Rugosimonospora sp.]|nr:hypothetical protein [Rugosimonospora sp.]
MDASGYAVVVPDVDDLLRRDASLLRGTGAEVRVTVRAAFVGLGPRAAVERYLSGVPYTVLTGVRPALGRLPVTLARVGGGNRPPAEPAVEPFWVLASAAGTLSWPAGWARGQQLALVIMRGDAGAAGPVQIAAAVHPAGLGLLTWVSLVVGVAGLAAGIALVLWPVRRREIVFVVEPAQVGALAARLGLRTPQL